MLDEEKSGVAGAANDLEQFVGGRDFLQLFGDEPLEGVLGETIAFLVGEIHQGLDGIGDFEFMFEGEFHRFEGVLEAALGSGQGGEFEAHAGLGEESDEAMGVGSLFGGLVGEMRAQPRKALELEPSGDGLVLEGGKEFHPDLGVDGGGGLLRDELFHGGNTSESQWGSRAYEPSKERARTVSDRPGRARQCHADAKNPHGPREREPRTFRWDVAVARGGVVRSASRATANGQPAEEALGFARLPGRGCFRTRGGEAEEAIPEAEVVVEIPCVHRGAILPGAFEVGSRWVAKGCR